MTYPTLCCACPSFFSSRSRSSKDSKIRILSIFVRLLLSFRAHSSTRAINSSSSRRGLESVMRTWVVVMGINLSRRCRSSARPNSASYHNHPQCGRLCANLRRRVCACAQRWPLRGLGVHYRANNGSSGAAPSPARERRRDGVRLRCPGRLLFRLGTCERLRPGSIQSGARSQVSGRGTNDRKSAGWAYA